MKNLEHNKAIQLSQIIQNKPGQRIAHFSEEDNVLCSILSNLSKSYDGEYFLHCCKNTFYDKSLIAYSNLPHVDIINFNLNRPRYLTQSREYDYLIITLLLDKMNKSLFLKKCYSIIKTGGILMIVVPNTDYVQQDEWKSLLEEQYYVSSNIIDDLFEHYDVVVSRRMHGWGNK